MSPRTSAGFATCVLLAGLSASASAQSAERVSFGAAVTLAHLPQPNADRPENVFPYVEAPHGNSRGVKIFGAARVSRRLAVGGELSIASPVTLTTVESHPSSYTTRTMTHRDTIVVGVLRVRTGRFVDVIGGGGIVSPRTSMTASGWTSGSPRGQVSFGPLVHQSPSNGARPALTVGADIAAPMHKHLAVLGIVRLYHLSRAAPLRSTPFGNAYDERPFLQPGSNVIRLGVGVRIIL